VAPRNETERVLAGIWQELLKAGRIGIHDNFFESGGHSILAMRMVSAVRKDMNAELTVKTIFQLPTIALIAKFIEVNQTNSLIATDDMEAIRL
jgi:hypothetical protein